MIGQGGRPACGYDQADLPRLLVFSEVVPESRFAGSLVLMRLLRDYPPEKLRIAGPRPHPESQTLPCRYVTLQDVTLARLYSSRFAKWKRSFEAFGFGGEVPVGDVEKIALDFRPEAILTVMEESQYYLAAGRFASRHHVPLLVIVHDLVELFEPVHSWAVSRQRKRNGEFYRAAAARFCVSPSMADCLREKYGVDSAVLYPSRSDDLMPRSPLESATLKREGRLTIGYAGGLSYGYAEGVQSILPALIGAGAVLRVYSPWVPGSLVGAVEAAGFSPTPMQTWERLKEECDVVLLPYAWEEGFRMLYDTHFPSKLTEYLALGMPVLISGPAYAAGVAWGLQHPKAVVTVSDPSVDAVRTACVRLRDDAGLRASLGAQSVLAGNQEFDPIRIREKFLRKLRDVVVRAPDAPPRIGSLSCG